MGTGTRTHPSQVTYNGDDLAAGGVKVTNLVKMVDQEDRHMPLLTVRETLAYAERFQAAVSGLACGVVQCTSLRSSVL